MSKQQLILISFALFLILLSYSKGFGSSGLQPLVGSFSPMILTLDDPIDPRPILSGPVFYRYKPHLIVHYTTSGIDSTSLVYAELVAVNAETCWARIINMGWFPPAPDPGRGTIVDPDSRYDIFIVDAVVGLNLVDSAYTNPFLDGVSNFIMVSNNLGTGGFNKAVVAHEFHHSCQGRCSNYEGIQLYENTSEFMVGELFPGTEAFPDDTYLTFGPLTFTYFQINSVASGGGDTTGYHGPGGLWIRFLHQHYGPSAPRLVWEMCGMHSGTHPYWDTDSVLRLYYDSNLEEALGHYAIWRYFTGIRDDGLHFQRADECYTANLHANHFTFPASGNQGSHAPRGPGGMNLIQFNTDGTQNLNISFDGQNGYKWRTYAICVIDSLTSYMQPMQLNTINQGSILIPAWMARKVALIPVVVNWYDNALDSTPALNFTYNATLVSDPVGLTDESQVLLMLDLISPNPMKDHATINYTLPKRTKGLLTIIDVTGRIVRKFELIGDGFPSKLRWDRTNQYGRKTSPGIYFCQLISNGSAVINKMVLE